MTYSDLIRLYFERSNSLQWYWTIYVLVIGGLLAFTSLRVRPDFWSSVLITVLYGCFAYKNLDAIHDVTRQRFATLDLIERFEFSTAEAAGARPVRESLEPALREAVIPWENARNFHVATDALTVLLFWTMEWRRRKRPLDQQAP